MIPNREISYYVKVYSPGAGGRFSNEFSAPHRQGSRSPQLPESNTKEYFVLQRDGLTLSPHFGPATQSLADAE